MLLYRDGQEFERSYGQRDPTALLLWLKDAREGRIGLGRISLLLVYGARERDLGLRLDYVAVLMGARAHDEAARESAWIYEHFTEMDDTLGLTQYTLFQRMGAIVEAHPPALEIKALEDMNTLYRRSMLRHARKTARMRP